MKLLSSLTNRIFLASAALTLLCTGVAIYVVNVRVTASAEEELQRDLVQAGAVVAQQRATVSDLYTVLARLVADLPKMKALVATDDAPTVEPEAAAYRGQVDSDLLLVTNRSGRVLAAPVRGARWTGLGAIPTIGEALAGRESATFWLQPEGILEVVSVPITAGAAPPEILGTLSLGFLLDDALAERFKGLTGSEIAFAAGGVVRAATLAGIDLARLDDARGRQAGSSIVVGGSDYVALVSPLAPSRSPSLFAAPRAPRAPGALGGEDVRPSVIVLRSRTERLRLLRPIRAALIVTGLIAMLAAVGLSYGLARTVTRPLDAINQAMKDIASTGDLTRKIAWRAGRWEDEDARLLTRTFNTLTESVARFQREDAQRERLSALGRLSTVIAHEVRNPLMIIKASLRPLTGAAVSPETVREAAADIDEEVGRLNRLVTGVLDFARPVRVEPAPADVNRVCEEAAAAVRAPRPGLVLHLDLERSLQPVVTDAEQLRAVLVNVLVNAAQAIEARAASGNSGTAGTRRSSGTEEWASGETASKEKGGHTPGASARERSAQPEGWDIKIATAPRSGGGVHIAVRDRGAGIPPADQARVFEPYFTTKRAGTGLGLAISRNIVEALGGRITLVSEAGGGTEVRIELAPAAESPRAGGGPA